MVVQEAELSITPIGKPVVIHLNQDDADFQLVFTIGSRSGTFTMESGTTAEIRGTKPDGSEYQASAAVSVPDCTVTVSGDKGMTDVPGLAKFEICLTHRRKRLFTQNFRVYVEAI